MIALIKRKAVWIAAPENADRRKSGLFRSLRRLAHLHWLSQSHGLMVLCSQMPNCVGYQKPLMSWYHLRKPEHEESKEHERGLEWIGSSEKLAAFARDWGRRYEIGLLCRLSLSHSALITILASRPALRLSAGLFEPCRAEYWSIEALKYWSISIGAEWAITLRRDPYLCTTGGQLYPSVKHIGRS